MGLDMYLYRCLTPKDKGGKENPYTLEELDRFFVYNSKDLEDRSADECKKILSDVMNGYLYCKKTWGYEKFTGFAPSILGFDTVLQWRKANWFHNWFVETVQGGEDDCGTYEVSKCDLEQLRWVIKECIPAFKEGNFEKLDTLLPPSQGFFFGEDYYGDYYIDTLEETLIELDSLLAYTDFDRYAIYYQSSW